jgi:hypothetical protein
VAGFGKRGSDQIGKMIFLGVISLGEVKKKHIFIILFGII